MQHPEIDAVWGPNPSCERGYAFPLKASKDGTKIAYASGKNLVFRDSADPTISSVTTTHRNPVAVASFSNDGNTVIGVDQAGSMDFFSVKGNTLEVNMEKRKLGIGGRVYDLAWYPNDQGIAIVGDAKKNGRVMTISGTDKGSISSSKRLTSVDMFFYDDNNRNVLKGKIATTSDDLRVRMYHYAKGGFSLNEDEAKGVKHSTNANMVRFSPDGSFLVSVGGKEIFVLDADDDFKIVAKTKGDKKKSEHVGNIYGVAWNSSSSGFLTVSADKTAKFWDWNPKSKSLTLSGTVDFKGTSRFGLKSAGDFQVGCCSLGPDLDATNVDKFISLSLAGDLNYVEVGGEAGNRSLKLEKSVTGVTSGIVSADADVSDGSISIVSDKGEVLLFDKDGTSKRVVDVFDPKPCVGVVKFGNKLFYTGWDDKIKELEVKETSLVATRKVVGLRSVPVYMSKAGNFFVTATANSAVVMKSDSPSKPIAEMQFPDGEVCAAAVSPDGAKVVVGLKDNTCKFFNVTGGSLTESKTVGPHSDVVVAMKFSPDGSHVAMGLKKKFVLVYSSTGEAIVSSQWASHTATITDVDFSPNGEKLLTAGSEGSIYIWLMKDTKKYSAQKHFRLAHPTGVANAKWVSEGVFYSTGKYDGSIKRWNVTI